MSESARTTLPGTVQKIIRSVSPQEPEKVEIEIETAEHLYREIRIDNELTDKDGHPVSLKKGAKVEVTVEAPPDAIVPAKP